MTGRASEVPSGWSGRGFQDSQLCNALLTQKVNVLVDGVALDSRPAQLLDELLAEILNVALLGTNLEGLLAGSVKVLLLTDVGHEADDTVALVQQVLEDT